MRPPSSRWTANMRRVGTLAALRAASPRLFAGLPEDAIRTILAASRLGRFSAGQVIIRRGDEAEQLFLLTTGRAKYYELTREGDEMLLELLTPGDVFGLVAFLPPPTVYPCSVQAMRDCELRVWKHATIRRFADEHPQLTDNLMRIGVRRAAACANRLVTTATEPAAHRLARALLDLGRRSGCVHDQAIHVDATNEDLSALANVSAFTTSRLLAQWQRNGTIVKKRGGVTIRFPEALLAG
jgi:CRP-like cAMP-binding protein